MDYQCTVCRTEFDHKDEPETFNSGGMVQAIFCQKCAERVSQFIFETLPHLLKKEREKLPW
jgi:hypothetical protein